MATQSFYGDVQRFTALGEKGLVFVARQTIQDMIDLATQTAVSQTRGGTLVQGKIPVDTGTLNASMITTLHGHTILSSAGTDAYSAVILGLQAGDAITVEWTAEYARPVHDGWYTDEGNLVPGWFWLERTLPQFNTRANINARRWLAKHGLL